MALTEGEAILVAPEQVHAERIGRTAPVAIAWIGFRAPEEALEGVPRHLPFSLCGWEESLRATIDTLHEENQHQPAGHEARLSLLLADLLVRLCRAANGAAPIPSGGNIRDHIEAARNYLERNATEDFTMEQLARYHGFSLSHFEVLFRKRFGCTPKQYQHAVKRRRIEQRMCDGMHSPKVLAAEHGFRDSAYFCRWFKKQTGMTPSVFVAKLSRE